MQLSELNRPEQYPHATHAIEWRETHISWVILTGPFAYKIKKPVNFGFLDFSTQALRKRYCEEEIRLNRRTAPDLYLGVIPLYRCDGEFNFCGVGEIVDYAVKMKQFDPDSLLLNKLPDNDLGADFFQSLGYQLADFHEHAETCLLDKDFGNAESVWYPVSENIQQIRPHLEAADDRKILGNISSWSETGFSGLTATFEQRKSAGMIRECHGDLHLGNIAVINSKPVLFDCIEFNDRFRWIDVASDLAFLIMDMQFHGYADQASRLLNSYLEYSFDYELIPVLRFYLVYRAMVRAKVAVLRLSEGGLSQQERKQTLQVYRSYAHFAVQKMVSPLPFVVITCGVSGSGKSTFARLLAARTDAIQIRSDVMRKHLVKLKPLQNSAELDPENKNALYTEDHSRNTFSKLQTLAENIVGWGAPVIVDATFLKYSHRKDFLYLANRLNVPFVIVFLDVSESELIQRIQARQRIGCDASEADVGVMQQQLSIRETFQPQEIDCVINVEPCSETDAMYKVINKIRDFRRAD
jgi:aminoglycoside phosphotransferase family enzyme/predicted kinase